MFRLGEKIKYFNKDVVVLSCNKNEVLLFIDEHTIKWVDRAQLESMGASA